MNWINRGTLVLQGNIDKGVNMKKALAIFVTVCLLASLFVSCDNTTKLDELVSTRFDAAESRSLIVSNEDFIGFNDPSIKWQYKAVKVSDTSYNVGAAAEWTLIPAKEYAIGDLRNSIEFSQGKWNFELRAVKTADTSVEVYYGETELPVLLTKKDGIRTISINLSTQHEGQKGYIVLDKIKVKHTSNGADAYDAPNKVIIDANTANSTELLLDTHYAKSAAGDSISSKTETGYKISVGTHTVKVQKIGANGEILAEEEKTIEVYAGLKTTISNWILEITQAGQFAPQLKGTETVTVPETGDVVVEFVNVTPSMEVNKSTTVTIPSAVVTSETRAVTLDIVVKDYRSVADHSFNVAPGKGVAASISLTMKDGDTVKTNFGSNKVTVETYIGTGLSGVTVKYNGDGDAPSDIEYVPATGKLTFKTTHFSEFYVEADKQAKIRDKDKGYVTLQAAVDAAEDDNTVILLVDVDSTQTLVVSKNITLDMNGKTISNTNDIWNDATRDWSLISVRGGNLTVTGEGSLRGKENDCFALDVMDGGTLVIENGTFVGNMDAIYVNKGSLSIKGGEYSIQQKSNYNDSRYLLNCLDENYKNGTASIAVEGGKFHGFNPANCMAEGAGTSFIVDWYSSKKIGTEPEAIYEVGSAVNDEEITISSVEGLKEFARLVNNDGYSFKGQTIKLVRDIDLKNEEWTPIGQKAGNKFSGVFDGNNKTISGLSITENNTVVTNALFDNYVGLFGAIDGGTVKKLTVSGSVTGINAAGIVARMDSGTIEDCISNVTVVGTGKGTDKDKGKAGGIVCLTNTGRCTINNCINNGNVSGVTEAGVGGIAAYVRENTTISGCTNNAEIGSNTAKYSGGIAGYVTDSVEILIERCTNTKSVTANGCAGGIVGIITGAASITNCSNSGAINAGQNGNGGGIAGSTHQSNITECRNTASVYGKYAGGVIGVDGASTITNCSGGKEDITSPSHTITFTGSNFTLRVEENESSGRIIGAHQGAGQYIYTVIKLLDDTNSDSNEIPTVGICGNTTTESYLKISSGKFHGDPLAGRTSIIVLEEGATWEGRAAGTYTRGGLDSSRKAEWTENNN